MNEFKVSSIIDAQTLQVEPFWSMQLKDNQIIKGNKIHVRGLEDVNDPQAVKKRLETILMKTTEKISFDSPELIEYNDVDDAIVSCTVFIARTEISYYFPELIRRH